MEERLTHAWRVDMLASAGHSRLDANLEEVACAFAPSNSG